jgi:hypothetical protein
MVTTATTSTPVAVVTVDLFSHDSRDPLDDVRNASYAVAEWLDGQDTSQIVQDYRAYVAKLDGAVGVDESAGRYLDLLNRAFEVARKAIVSDWIGYGKFQMNLTIEPNLNPSLFSATLGQNLYAGC